MKVLLIYYTGTYNTRYVTKKIKEEFEIRNHEVTTFEITTPSEVIDVTTYDLIGFGYPIYGFNSPKPFNQYIKKLVFNKKQKYFIYKNSGETLSLNNASSRIIKRIFYNNKMKCIGEYHYIMPYNIRFPFDKEFIKEIFVYNEKLRAIMFYNFEHGIIKTLNSNFLGRATSLAVSIQKPGSIINSFLYKVDNTKCIKCMKCVNNCPHHNIKLVKGNIKFGHHCDMCMRCSFYCPTNAIKIGMLENWKVTNYFSYDEIENQEYVPYINDSSTGFYKCFIKTFKEIDKEYLKIQNEENMK